MCCSRRYSPTPPATPNDLRDLCSETEKSDDHPRMSATPFQLERNPHGRLRLTLPDGTHHDGVVPVRAFPIAAPGECVSLVDAEGRELVCIAALAELPTEQRAWIEDELAQREFTPVIASIVAVSTFSTPSIWQVETDRGATSFVLKGEEDIRRLPGGALWIADSCGIQFIVRDRKALDRRSRRLLDRFL